MPTRDEIKAALAAQRERVEAWFHALPADDMLRPVTASEVADAEMWTPKDHLAHVLTGERYFQGAIKRALSGTEDALGFFTQTGSDDRTAHRNVINQANERTANKYRAEPVEAIFARIGETRQATLALLDSVDDDQLAQSVAHSRFGDGTLGALFMIIAQHAEQHIKWLDTALAERDAQSR